MERPVVNPTPEVQEQEVRKPNRFWRFLKRLFYTLLLLLLLLLTGGFIIGYFYGDEVKQYIITELNKQLNTQVIVEPEDINFTVIRNFPNASIEFSNVKALDAVEKKKKDTLFRAGNISLQFNIMDIFNKNYKIKKIEVDDVDLRLWIDKKGNVNYDFLKEDSTAKTGEGQSLDFSVEKIVMRNVAFRYLDHRSKQDYSVHVNKANLSGKFSDAQYSLEAVGDVFVHHIKSDSSNYLSEKPAKVNMLLDVNKDVYSFTDATIKIVDLDFKVAGTIDNSTKDTYLALKITGQDMDIQSVLSILPEKEREHFNDYESEGEFYFNSSVLGTSDDPVMTASFGIKKGTITQKSSSVTLKNVDLEGSFQSTAMVDADKKVKSGPNLNIKNFKANLGDGSLSGNLMLENFKDPVLSAKLEGAMQLDDLAKLLKLDTIESLTGSLKINANYQGRIKEKKKYMTGDFNDVKASGEMSVSDVSMRLKDNLLKFDSINGSFLFNNNDIVINGFSGRVSNTDFQLKGFFRNILAYFFLDNETLTVDATFRSNNIDLNELLSDKSSPDKKDNAYTLKLSEYLDLNLDNEIRHITFRRFEASNIRGVLKMKDKKMIADPLSFSTMDGNVVCSGMIDGSPEDKLLITCDANLKSININKLFYQFENFGQEYIQDKNLKGMGTAEVQFASVWTPQLDVDLDKIYVRSNLNIERGELLHFEPLKELSRFIKVSELEEIRFSNLQNQIEIKNQTIYIPKMEVNSSALNVTASGSHTFGNAIDYKVKVLLSDLLSKKAKKAKKENDEFGVVEDDGLGKTALYLSMTGTVDDMVIKYDSKSAMDKLKNDLKTEKQTLKSILREEFGWFKKDTTGTQGKKPGNKEDGGKFIIKWDEEEKEKKKDDDDDF